MPSISFAREGLDSLVLSRIWNFKRNFTQNLEGYEQTIYMRYSYDTQRRNATLFLVPNMYSIARGDRQFLGESFGKLTFSDASHFDLRRQLVSGTIPHNREVMAAQFQYLAPSLYDVSLYPGKLLSPFHSANRIFYSYHIYRTDGMMAVVMFKPKLKNTQLVTGRAVADINTGRLQFVSFSGEFDLLSFSVTATMSDNVLSLLPQRCNIDATFRFLGNRINANFTALFDSDCHLPDSISDQDDRPLMSQLRPIPLKKSEEAIYTKYDRQQAERARLDSAERDTARLTGRTPRFEDTALDFIDDHLLSSHNIHSGGASVHFSPLLNPQYLGYSRSKGISYKLTMGARYAWNAHRYLTLNPLVGYNTRLNQIYYSIPLRMTYNPKRNGYAELTINGGDRTFSGLLAEDLRARTGDSISAPEFRDTRLRAINNVVAYDWLEITAGLIYHRRSAIDRERMRRLDLPAVFRSFAPMLTVKLTPWSQGPTLTANYEHAFRNILKANLDYDRWEFDAAYKQTLASMRQLNLRAGAGFYTHRNTNYFVDYSNFRDVNLPTGWDDEWAGEFQLLDAERYNASNYYIRTHASYDSPLLGLSWWPVIGRLIEMERIYVSALSTEHSLPYYEIGYGFTTQFFSAGLFASFAGEKFQNFGCKLTLELFKRW